jgi:hypothetical protein
VNDLSVASDDDLDPSLRVRFQPVWTYIEGIREFGRFFCEQSSSDRRLAERAQVIIQEALENTVKYSIPGPLGELELKITQGGTALEISVLSTPAPSHLADLRDEMERVAEIDAEAAYITAFERAATSPSASARLGLARMRYEGAAELTMCEEPGGRIRLTAKGKL